MFPKNTIEFLRSIVRIKKNVSKIMQQRRIYNVMCYLFTVWRDQFPNFYFQFYIVCDIHTIQPNISIACLYKLCIYSDEYWIFCICFYLLIDLTLLKHLFLLLIANNILTMVNVTIYSFFLLLVKIYWF